jgi:hypothetical protein
VLREYSNCFRLSDRSPEVYKTEDTLKTTAQQIFCIPDEADGILDYAVDIPGGDGKGHNKSMLFRKWNSDKFPSEGKIEVIAVPYLAGSHVCTSARQALSLVKKLQNIHKQGIAHADIRAFNLLFSFDSETAHFLDWDFGGRIKSKNGKSLRYPLGYANLLRDGLRIGRSRGVVKLKHDVAALAHVFGVLHDVVLNYRFLFWKNWQLEILHRRLQKASTLNEMESILKKMGNARFEPSLLYQNYLNELVTKNSTAQLGYKISPDRRKKSKDRSESAAHTASVES